MGETCSVCSNLRFQPLRPRRQLKALTYVPNWFQSNLVSLSDIKLSSIKGCVTCKFVLQVMVHYELQLEEDDTLLIRTYKFGGTLLRFPDQTIQVYTPEGHANAWDGIMKGLELSRHAHSDQANQFIRSCLDRCLDLHPNCVQPGGRLPSRLIDIGSSHNDHVRLVETSPNSHYEYIALSYCWGEVDVVKTTNRNYDEMKMGVLVSTLPRTIQDAIIVTRKLGQRYLWVDAICIIQDSKLDWEIESANMASIYRSSLLTIAAATAAAASDGFLNQEHSASEAKPPYQQIWYDEHGDETTLAARVVPEFETHTDDADEDDPLPLSLRGWTLQEQKLSTRTISYRRRELWWSCLTESSCECHIINELPGDVKKFCFNSTYSITTAEEMYREWHSTVAAYTVRALKYSSDKLPAIAGIAKVVQELTKSVYIAGLWKDNLIHDLTWEVPELRNIEAQSSVAASPTYFGPTFSWISVNRDVTYGWDDRKFKATQCDILATESLAAGLNPLGHVESAYLTISAPLLNTVLLLRYEDNNDPVVSQEGYFISCGSEDFSLRADVALETFEGVNQDGVMEKSVRRSYTPKTRAKSGTPISLLYLGNYTLWKNPKTKHVHAERAYLVLGKSQTDMARYERIGIAYQNCIIHGDSSEVPCFFDGFSEGVLTIV
ncbi:HET-domain-containing protein [Xylaria cf. heliscus]|nr:HET-domain-containing protein [Xylaria cf. heliscus]